MVTLHLESLVLATFIQNPVSFFQLITHSLVQLVGFSILVVTLPEFKVAQLKRSQFGICRFDMVIFHSDFTRSVTQTNSIPIS